MALLSFACGEQAADERAWPPSELPTRSAPAPAAAPQQPEPDCPAERAYPRDWPPTPEAFAGTPMPGGPATCVTPQTLLDPDPVDAPIHGVVASDGERLRFIPYAARDAVYVSGYVVVTTAAGVFVHDASTLRRLARLSETAATHIARDDDGMLVWLEPDAEHPIGHSHAVRNANEPDRLDAPRRFRPGDAPSLHHARGPFVIVGARTALVSEQGDDGILFTLMGAPEGIRGVTRVPGRRGPRLAFVGTGNRIHLASGRLAPAYQGLLSRRDLWVIDVDPTTGHIVLGGDGDRARIIDGLPSRGAPEDVASYDVAGNLRVARFGRRSELLTGTDRGELTWRAREGRVIGTLPPLLMPGASAPLTADVFRDRSVVGTFMGRLFIWHPGGSLLRAPHYEDRTISETGGPSDAVLAVGITGGRIAVHRYEGPARVDAITTHIGTLPWHQVRHIARAGEGSTLLVGAAIEGSEVALVTREGQLVRVTGPDSLPRTHDSQLHAHPDGRRYFLQGEEGRVFEIDVTQRAWRNYGWIPDDARLGFEEGATVVIDARGRSQPWP